MGSAFRYLLKNKSYAFINLFGLTLGLTISIFIFLYVQDELSYDKYLPGYDEVVRIQPKATLGGVVQEWATSEGFLNPTLTSMYPEIESTTRILRNDNEIVFKTDGEQFSENGVVAVDSTFFKVFPFQFIYGDRNTALDKPGGIVLSKQTATKFFGNINPVGKFLTTDFATSEVTGVIEDVPHTSHFNFKVLFPLKGWWRDVDQSRNMYAFYSYARLSAADQREPLAQKLVDDWLRIFGYMNADGTANPPKDFKIELRLMPLADIHLSSHAEKEYGVNGQLQVVYIFIVVAILIVVIAAINYINLSNAMAIKRAKEVAVRKTIGATSRKLFLNFILESCAFSFVAFVLSLVAVVTFLPSFNDFTGKQINFAFLADVRFSSAVIIAWILLGVLSGSYPAMVLSSFNPIQALKSGAAGGKTGNTSLYLRRGLIVSQFTISALLIVSTFTIQKQLHFIENKNIGFNKNNVIVVPLVRDVREKFETLKNELSKLETVESVAATSAFPGKRVVILTVRVPDLAGQRAISGSTDDGSREMRVLSADHDYVKTLGLQLKDGRDFTIENAADITSAFLLNEAAVKEFDLKDPVGRPFEYTFGGPPKKGQIIGVVKDFNFASVHSKVDPLMIHIQPSFYSTLCIRLKPGEIGQSINEVEGVWKSITAVPFSFSFLDTGYDAMYKAEQTTGKVITYFTVIALIIAGLGLFGIVSFFVAQRTREVGIRKVFGASRVSLLKVLSREYIIMVIVGNLIAFYPAYALVSAWLQQFAYRVDFSFSTFVIAFVMCELLAFVSIIYVIFKTAQTNPAVILRHE
jgi:putative ABC transport system permease protein